MSMTGALSAAVSGLNASALRFGVAANNIVNANTPGFKAGRVETVSAVAGGVRAVVREGGGVDIAREFVAQIQAENSYAANALVIRSIDGLLGSLFDIEA